MTRSLSNLTRMIFVVVCVASGAAHAADWRSWRGPTADGHSTEKGLPTEWTAESVTWKAALPGFGQSSPSIDGERIFLTAALDGGRQRVVFCVNRADGKTLWEQVAWTGSPEPTHRMNGHASATCCTDSERVYAFFGKGGLHCYTVQGERVWSRDLGDFPGPWGSAASPVLVGETVVQNCDSEGEASITAFDKKSGETVWSTPREKNRGWSTPVLVKTPQRDELALSGHTGVRAYDPITGKELWYCQGFRGRGTPTVTPAGGLLHVINGQAADIYAITPGGAGTVTQTHMAWHTPRSGDRDLPSPLVVDGCVFAMNMKGVLTGYEAATGREMWQGRVGGNFSAAPVAFGGLAYFISEAGEVVALRPDREKMDIAARNAIAAADDELFRASPIPSAGQVFLRSDKNLYCVGTRQPPAAGK